MAYAYSRSHLLELAPVSDQRKSEPPWWVMERGFAAWCRTINRCGGPTGRQALSMLIGTRSYPSFSHTHMHSVLCHAALTMGFSQTPCGWLASSQHGPPTALSHPSARSPHGIWESISAAAVRLTRVVPCLRSIMWSDGLVSAVSSCSLLGGRACYMKIPYLCEGPLPARLLVTA